MNRVLQDARKACGDSTLTQVRATEWPWWWDAQFPKCLYFTKGEVLWCPTIWKLWKHDISSSCITILFLKRRWWVTVACRSLSTSRAILPSLRKRDTWTLSLHSLYIRNNAGQGVHYHRGNPSPLRNGRLGPPCCPLITYKRNLVGHYTASPWTLTQEKPLIHIFMHLKYKFGSKYSFSKAIRGLTKTWNSSYIP